MTQEQFNILVTKDDLKEELKVLEEKVDNKLDKILTAVDNIIKKHEDHEIEHVSNQAAHDRMEGDIEKHDSRIGKLELSVA